MTTTTDFDTLRHHRVPVVDRSQGLSAYWVVGVDSESQPVSDEDAALIRSYTECVVRSFYREHYVTKMLNDPNGAGDSGHNTVILHHWANGGWGYEKCMWQQLPVPVPYQEPVTLLDVLDRIERRGDGVSDRWATWKAEHEIGTP